MATINPYLNFDGKAEEAFNFYKAVFGGEFVMLQRFKDTPYGEKISAADGEKIMHVALPIGSNIIMASDSLESMGKIFQGNNFSISITAESKEEADKLFNGLSKNGTIQMPLEESFWGSYFGMLTDNFGIKWMVDYELKK
jgi:PhnB protein